jgi:hypothetical protein
MRRPIWLWFTGAGVLVLIGILFAASYYLRIEPLPTAAQIQDAARRRHAERLHDIPSVKNLPAIEPMKIEQVLILEQIDGLVPGKHEQSKPWFPPSVDASSCPPEVDFRVEYLADRDGNTPAVVVEVHQYPNEAWPLYFVKWSPIPGILQDENPRLVLTRVEKFRNQVVMDRQFRSPDETGILWFFWPSGRNLVSITYRSRVIDEQFLRRYLEKFPSSL